MKVENIDTKIGNVHVVTYPTEAALHIRVGDSAWVRMDRHEVLGVALGLSRTKVRIWHIGDSVVRVGSSVIVVNGVADYLEEDDRRRLKGLLLFWVSIRMMGVRPETVVAGWEVDLAI